MGLWIERREAEEQSEGDEEPVAEQGGHGAWRCGDRFGIDRLTGRLMPAIPPVAGRGG
jgi:hypothetical protein